MKIKGLLKQNRLPQWLGGMQIQFQQSLLYINLYNTAMILITLWYTSGYQITRQHAPWITMWLFLLFGFLFGLLLIAFVGFMDYKFILPTRISFINSQTCKHPNPAMESLIRLEADMAKIKERLGIK